MRNVVTVPLNEGECLVIASDNSGGVGIKELDSVQVSYEIVSYYSFRVAVMDCIAAGAMPISVVLHNFCGNDYWDILVSGVKKGLAEINLAHLTVTGSTESNFSMRQSAVGIVVIGRKVMEKSEISLENNMKVAVIGRPLVGEEVITHGSEVAPLSLFKEIADLEDVRLWPVGSKGILYEIKRMFGGGFQKVNTDLNLKVSSGPSTCFIVAYDEKIELSIKQLSGELFHPVSLN
ncbi:ATP-binding protein [Bacillus sp. 31A1R]|uniref:ATP-binding protein n=1 Tax=Robertmurraya mangrovi TaxID=3098077 RepID=A0ABU5J4A0_9BACI|nr:ATP-binding protein [Bacillus sp. 31A1R]MDZ5474218.1 ATP-binding protein [Bacillus sp. 31A1R]